MERISLQSVVDANLEAVRTAPGGHTATTVHGGSGRRLRQTVLALAAGSRLGEHTAPGECTLLVLEGSVRLDTGEHSAELGTGELVEVPADPHSVTAVEDSALLLTVSLS
jgi:quercetin dioxygenase-like cupin family protein